MINKRYNQNAKRLIKLEDGEKFCPKCDGKGRVPHKWAGYGGTRKGSLTCDKCLGEGKIDWIENATGKKAPQTR